MSTTAMVEQRPPSPPPSLSEEYQYGLHHLLQHNAAVQRRPHQYPPTNGYIHSGQVTAYGSPTSGQLSADQYGRDSRQLPYATHENVGLGIQYDWYGNPTDHQNLLSNYENAGQGQLAHYPSRRMTFGSPPTPTASDISNGERQTIRNGRATVPDLHSRLTKSNQRDKSHALGLPKAKKNAKQMKTDKSKIPKINAPLSELTKTYNHIPIRNMEEWVNRPTEVRRKEVEKRNGYVTRPMNSFMLYRSAYAERTKMWCLQNNHQIVSSVSGESWPMEPPEVREQYNEYARIERDNHQKAHPGYKFSPSKAQGNGRKRKETPEISADEEPSDLDDPDFEWRPSAERRSKARSGKRQGREAGYPVNSTPQSHVHGNLVQQENAYNRSSYQATNPGKPPPAVMGEQNMFGQYYQTTVHPSYRPNVEDVRIRKMEAPSKGFDNAPPLLGLPGTHHHELLDERSLDSGPSMFDQNQVDPTLLTFDGVYAAESNGVFTEQQFREYNNDALLDATSQSYRQYDGHVYNSESIPWQYGDVAHASGGNDFDNWIEENNDR